MAKFIISKSKVLEQYNKIKQFANISFSFKTNPKIGQILEENTKSMFSVHFINELKLINNKSKVWFLAQALNNKLLDDLFSLKVNKFVIENLQDLQTLLNYLEKNNYEIELLLRMKLKENTLRTEKHYVFGIESDEINKQILKLKDNKFINKIGIHVHRKTQNVSEWRLKQELDEIIDNQVLENIDFLNIGGGIPAKYKNISDKIIPLIFNKIKLLKKWTDSLNIQLIIEPGRFISASAVKLETEIMGIHGIGKRKTIVVDASVYNSSMDTLIVPIKLLVDKEIEKTTNCFEYIIKGITPCSTDIFRYRVYFENEKKIGDKIIFLNAGAYNFHTDFCELDKIKTEIIE